MKAVCSVLPAYLDGISGKLFYLLFEPNISARGVVLIVPPFAEEMNRCRRSVFMQSQRLVAAGYRVVVPDLYGTGDSDGDFSQARWEIWRKDLVVVASAFAEEGRLPISLLALRLGALLALDTLRVNSIKVQSLVFWQPVISGEIFMSQFLRMRSLSGLIARDRDNEDIKSLRLILDSGGTLEIAGYELSPSLFQSISRLRMTDILSSAVHKISWYDVVSIEGMAPPFQSAQCIREILRMGVDIAYEAVLCPPFWSTPEISIATDLVEATTDHFANMQ